MADYDVIIIGGGPAGLTAAIYATRARLSTLLLERGAIGGQLTLTELVENFPGFPQGVGGTELGELMHQQAKKYSLVTVLAEVSGLDLSGREKLVRTSAGDFRALAIVITSGAEHRKLGVPGEERLTGKGVSYCALCDAPFFRDQAVAIVGAGDSAVTEALFLTKYAQKVTLIHRRRELRADKVLQEQVLAHPRMEFLWDTVVEEVVGEEGVQGLKLRQVKAGEHSELKVDGVFVSIGFIPKTDFLRGVLPLDEGGHVPVNQWMETGIPGVFAAGDVRQHSPRQAITAAGDGATAAIAAERYLSQLKG